MITDGLRCGVSSPNPDVESRYNALRENEGRPTVISDLCGKPLDWQLAYRCLECGRWAHAKCLADHFKRYGNRQVMMVGHFAHNESDVMGPWTGGVTPA